MLGFCRPYYPRKAFMGREEEQCWCWFCAYEGKSQICENDEKKKKNSWKDIHAEFPSFQEGEVVTFHVNKKRKTIHVKRERREKYLLYGNADFPDELAIAVSRKTDSIDVELIRYEERFGRIEYTEDRWMDQKIEKFRSVCEGYGTFRIPLKNRELNLPKIFLLGSNIPNLKHVNEYFGLNEQHFDLPISDVDICHLISEYPSRDKINHIFNSEGFNLVDYYRFSLSLGLKTGLSQVKDILSSLQQWTFKKLYLMFRESCEKLEGGEVRSWFSKDNVLTVRKKPKNMKKGKPQKNKRVSSSDEKNQICENTFKSAFCMQCFVEMKRRIGELDTNRDLFKLDIYVGMIKTKLMSWDPSKTPLQYHRHESITKRIVKNLSDSGNFHDIFCRLQRDRNYLSNITIISSDKKQFPAHKEVLLCGYLDRFNPEMFSKDCISTVSDQNNNNQQEKQMVFRIDDMEGALLRIFLDFAYQSSSAWLGNVPLFRIIIAMYHANKYRDFRLLSILCERLEKSTQPTGKKEDVEEVVRKTGHLIFKNYELSPWIIPRLIRHSNRTILKEEILEIVKKAHEKYMVTHHVTYLTEKVKGNEEEIGELKKYIEIQNNEMGVLRNENIELKERMIRLEYLVRKKFEE